MKKRFTFLIAALMLLTMISQPTRLWGQERANFEINTTNFTRPSGSGSGYTAYDGNHTINGITISSKNVMVQSSKLQFRKTNDSELHNTTEMPGKITKITLATTTGFTIYVGTSSNPSSTTVSSGSTITGNYTYFKIKGSNSTTATTATITVEYTPTHTLTYSATNGSISGVVYNTSTAVASGASVAEGGKVTLTATPSSGYAFTSWEVSGTGSTLSSTSTNPTTFTMGTANATVTANFSIASGYVNVSPTTTDVTTSSQNIVFNVDTDQTLTASSVQFYTAASGGTTASKPDWIGTIVYDGSSSPKTLTVPVAENTGVARHAYFTLKNGTVESSRITINQAAITVLPPTFNHGTGTYYEDQSITLTNQTDGASIYYTTGANPADPTSSSTPYTESISVTATTKIKAVAIKNGVSSEVTTAEYTITHPITIAEAREQATGAVTTRGIVTYISGKYAYIQDASEAALCLYKTASNWNSSTTELTVGDDVVASGTLSTYSGGGDLLEISNPTRTILSSGNAKPCVTKTVAQINTDNFDDFQGLFVQIVEATYNGSSANTVTQNGQTVSVNGTMGEATTNDVVTFKGNITYNSGIIIRNLQDVFVIADPTITAASSISVPDYIKGTPESGIDVEILTVNGTNLTEDITVELEDGESSAFEISDDLDTWGYSITLSETDGSVTNAEIAVRLKVGKNVADYSDIIILSSDGATTVNVNVTGSVTYANVTYNGNAEGVTNVPTDAEDYTYNQQVTVLGEGSMARTGYDFVKWNTESDGTGDDYKKDDTFYITEDVTLYAQWTAKSYNITADPAITHGSISFTVGGVANSTSAKTGETVTIVSTPDSGYGLTSVSVNSGAVTVTNNTFVMPASDVTVSVTFVLTATDELTASLIGQSSYGNWSGKYHVGEAVYAGNSTTGGSNSSSIQLRDNTNSGIVTTTSGGTARKVSVTWNSSTTTGRTLQVYGKNQAYSGTTGASDLYDADKRGTLIGTIVYGTSTELTINDNYGYIGMRSSSGAMYLDEIEITWAAPTHALTYDANGGTGTMTDPSSPYKYNASVTVLAKANTITAPSGKMFARWDTNADGNGTSYAPGDIFSMPKNDMTLYAIWEDECNETATMAATSGTKEYVNDEGELSFKINLSSKVTALSSCADITEYGFVYSTDGITTPTVGGANCTKIVKGTEYTTANTVFEHELAGATLGATYKICSYATNLAGTVYGTMATVAIDADYPSYTISYSTNGTAEGSTTKIYQGNAISNLIEPTSGNVPAGYTFQGWSTSDVALTDTKPSLVKNGDAISANLTLKAVFAIGTTNEGEFTKSYGWEDADDASVWTITNTIAKTSGQGYNSSSNAGKINTNHTYVTFNDKVRVKEFSFAFKRTSNNDNYNVYIETSLLGESWEAIETYAMSSFDKNGTYAVKTHAFDGTTAQYVRFHCYNTTAERYVDDVTITYDAEYTTYSNYCTSVASIEDNPKIDADGELTDDITISSGAFYIESPITIPDGYTLTVNGTGVLANANPANLIIEEGGQLILPDNTKVKATVKKATAGSSAEKTETNNLYAISSPVDGIAISSFAQETHNVYQYYEPTTTWQEYRNENNEFDNLAIGRGYLYRSSVENIELAGNVTGGDKNGKVEYTLSYACGVAKYKGLNLVGNPFTHDITWSDLSLENVESAGCYMLVEDLGSGDHGKWKAVAYGNVTVKPMQAFFVQATDEDASITFNNTAGGGKGVNYANDNIMFSVKNSKCSDEAYVMFMEGHGLNKIEHRNNEIPMLYIMNNGQNYAIADMSDDTEVINVGFEAKTMGQYSISIKTEGQYSYMHLYDKVTGDDIDMLVEDSYTFVGAPNDRKDRFVLNLNYNAANINTDSDIFAYQSGSDIIIRGDGELHVFDVMGRLVLTQRVNGVETISMQSQGVYIFKLNGMTQKIVVR